MNYVFHMFLNPPLAEYAWAQVVLVSDKSCEIDIPTDDEIKLLGDARTNIYCGIAETSFLMQHQIPYSLAKNEYLPRSRCCSRQEHGTTYDGC
jgi:hypothetical protein